MLYLECVSPAKTLGGNVVVKKKSLSCSFLLLTELHVISFPMETKAMKTRVVCYLFIMFYLVFLPYMVHLPTLVEKGQKLLKVW